MGSATASLAAGILMTGMEIRRDDSEARFSGTTRRPHSAGYSTSPDSWVHGLLLKSPAFAPAAGRGRGSSSCRSQPVAVMTRTSAIEGMLVEISFKTADRIPASCRRPSRISERLVLGPRDDLLLQLSWLRRPWRWRDDDLFPLFARWQRRPSRSHDVIRNVGSYANVFLRNVMKTMAKDTC